MKWKIAALTFITWPVAIWFVDQAPETRPLGFWLTLGSVPLFTAILMELRDHWSRVLKDPTYVDKGSPVGNKIAVALAGLILGLVLFGIGRAIQKSFP